MKHFIRRHYYDKQTGGTVYSFMMQGDILNPFPSIEDEYADNPALERRSEQDTGVFEWVEPDLIIEKNFDDSYGRVTVNIGAEPPELVFDYSPLPPIEPPVSQNEPV